MPAMALGPSAGRREQPAVWWSPEPLEHLSVLRLWSVGPVCGLCVRVHAHVHLYMCVCICIHMQATRKGSLGSSLSPALCCVSLISDLI